MKCILWQPLSCLFSFCNILCWIWLGIYFQSSNMFHIQFASTHFTPCPAAFLLPNMGKKITLLFLSRSVWLLTLVLRGVFKPLIMGHVKGFHSLSFTLLSYRWPFLLKTCVDVTWGSPSDTDHRKIVSSAGRFNRDDFHVRFVSKTGFSKPPACVCTYITGVWISARLLKLSGQAIFACISVYVLSTR